MLIKRYQTWLKWGMLSGLIWVLAGCSNAVNVSQKQPLQQTTHLEVTEQIGVLWNH